MKDQALKIIREAIQDSLPEEAVRKAMGQIPLSSGRLILIAVGKASWDMAKAAFDCLGDRIDKGAVITKYGYSRGPVGNLEIWEAGHPVPDEMSFSATSRALELVKGLNPSDQVLFLLSGGGSALFEKPLIDGKELASITDQLLSCGAGIVEVNTVRKRLSAVKAGRFGLSCSPAKVYTVVLSDIIGDPLDMIASGPAYPDSSRSQDALAIVKRYGLDLSDRALKLLAKETVKELFNVATFVTGSVRQLCESAEKTCLSLGYEPVLLTSSLSCEAREAGAFLAAIAREHQSSSRSLAFLAGGETVVRVKGKGLGGRNQEIALSAALGIDRCRDTAVFSFGSDGTDGPTDAAGAIVDEHSAQALKDAGFDGLALLAENDSYRGLEAIGALVKTGPTGTNVNDLSAVLIKR